MLLFTHHYPETCKPKFHCRRQSGMNFGYVTVNGVNSNTYLITRLATTNPRKIKAFRGFNSFLYSIKIIVWRTVVLYELL